VMLFIAQTPSGCDLLVTSNPNLGKVGNVRNILTRAGAPRVFRRGNAPSREGPFQCSAADWGRTDPGVKGAPRRLER
jgi:hypothetical protein